MEKLFPCDRHPAPSADLGSLAAGSGDPIVPDRCLAADSECSTFLEIIIQYSVVRRYGKQQIDR